MKGQEKKMEDRATRDEDRLSRKVKRLLNGLSGFRKHQILQLLLVVVEGFEVEREMLIRELDDKDHINKLDIIELLRKFDIPTAEFDFTVGREVAINSRYESPSESERNERQERVKPQATSMIKKTCNEPLQHPQVAATESDRDTSSSEDDSPPSRRVTVKNPVKSDRDDDSPPSRKLTVKNLVKSHRDDDSSPSRRVTVKRPVESDRNTSSSGDDLPPPVNSPTLPRVSGKRRRIYEEDSNGKFHCPYCSKVYTCYQNVDRHVSEAHLKTAAVHWCPHKFCMYSSLREHDVVRHYKRLHEATSPQMLSLNECYPCGKGFVTPSNLYRHIEKCCPFRKKRYSNSNASEVPEMEM